MSHIGGVYPPEFLCGIAVEISLEIADGKRNAEWHVEHLKLVKVFKAVSAAASLKIDYADGSVRSIKQIAGVKIRVTVGWRM